MTSVQRWYGTSRSSRWLGGIHKSYNAYDDRYTKIHRQKRSSHAPRTTLYTRTGSAGQTTNTMRQRAARAARSPKPTPVLSCAWVNQSTPLTQPEDARRTLNGPISSRARDADRRNAAQQCQHAQWCHGSTRRPEVALEATWPRRLTLILTRNHN